MSGEQREKVIKGLECCSQMVGEMCIKCPYANECEEGESLLAGAAHLAADALTQLKAQEPRVMTLEDAKQTMEGEIVWVEQWTKSKVFLMPMVSTGDGRLGNFYLGLNLNEMNPHYYRVWRGKPTDEQREKVKWE